MVPGAILRVSLDVDHWLAAGADGEIQVMVESQRVFTPITLDKGRNVGVYQARDTLVASGLVWDQVQQGLARKAYLIEQPMGQGRIIAFAEDPNARAYAEASSLLFMNAILLGGRSLKPARTILRALWIGELMLLGLLLAAATRVAAAQPAPALELSPGTTYDKRIPTAKEVLGYDFGDEITPPDRLIAYLQALAAAAPERTRLIEYARSYEGRRSTCFVIGSPERIAQLDRLKQGLRRLADPRGLAPAEADTLIRELPAVVWLMHAVHGNEISSSDAALAEAYHLLAAENDPRVGAILRDAVVHDRPAAEPRRPRTFRVPEPARPRAAARRRARGGRARRAVAGRPVQSLPVRHESRLVRAVAARDAWPHPALPRVVSARRRRPARDGRRLDVLLRAAG